MRIVSLLASATEIVCALGAGGELMGRSHECDHPEWVKTLPACTRPAFDVLMSSGQIDAEVRRRLHAGEPLYHVDQKLIRALRPDLVIAQAHCEVCAVTPEQLRNSECGLGEAAVVALEAGNLEGIFRDIGRLAVALGRAERGDALVTALRGRLERMRERLAGRERPTVVMLEWTDPVYPMSNWGPELVEIAQGRLLLGTPGEHSRATAWERVREADPEYLLVAPCGYDLVRAVGEIAVLERYPGWNDLRAVREGKVVIADGNRYFNRSGMTVVETAEMIADILHGTGFYAGSSEQAWGWCVYDRG